MNIIDHMFGMQHDHNSWWPPRQRGGVRKHVYNYGGKTDGQDQENYRLVPCGEQLEIPTGKNSIQVSMFLCLTFSVTLAKKYKAKKYKSKKSKGSGIATLSNAKRNAQLGTTTTSKQLIVNVKLRNAQACKFKNRRDREM